MRIQPDLILLHCTLAPSWFGAGADAAPYSWKEAQRLPSPLSGCTSPHTWIHPHQGPYPSSTLQGLVLFLGYELLEEDKSTIANMY